MKSYLMWTKQSVVITNTASFYTADFSMLLAQAVARDSSVDGNRFLCFGVKNRLGSHMIIERVEFFFKLISASISDVRNSV